jgi:hypothetical protein
MGREASVDIWRWIDDDIGAAETSTIFAWIVVGVLVVMGLLAALQALGTDVIGFVRDQLGI